MDWENGQRLSLGNRYFISLNWTHQLIFSVMNVYEAQPPVSFHLYT
uniref:Uncharacterized protein n=1 Tax=Picea glauca TaxID=3330 RepID=A0A101LYS0_PICGL|nr:hypothetical protein ABT39_MTgene5855 [Picea glauca]